MKQINDIRVSLDERAQDIGALGSSRAIKHALTTLQQGRMLLGSVLGKMGELTSYPDADNPDSPAVAPAVDVAAADYAPALPAEPIAAVKTVRSRLEVSLAQLDAIRPAIAQECRESIGDLALVWVDAARSELKLSKSWLGMELSRLAGKAGA